MATDRISAAHSRAEELIAEVQVEGRGFHSELNKSLQAVKRIHDRARESKERPAKPSEGKVFGSADDPDVQEARGWLAPRMRLLQEAVKSAGESGRASVFSELEERVRRLESSDRTDARGSGTR